MRVLFVAVMCVFLVGCAQAVKDYQTGASTPLVNGEVSPSQQATVISNTVSSLPVPFAGPIAMGVGFLATVFFTWQRGVSIRNAGGAPTATAASKSAATNGILQDVANIFAGMFTTASATAPSTAGTIFQRVWKVALATLASGTALAASNADVAAFLAGHPVYDGIFVALSSGLAGLEKALSTVPVATTTAVTAAGA